MRIEEWIQMSPALWALAAFVAGYLLSRWRREKPSDVKRQERRADVYTFLLDAWTRWYRLAPDLDPSVLAGEPEGDRADLRERYADLRAEARETLRVAEQQLQLHGARRVLRDYRRLQEDLSELDAESTKTALMNVIVEMRRDLGHSVYSEMNADPLGIDLEPRSSEAVPARPASAPSAASGDGEGSIAATINRVT